MERSGGRLVMASVVADTANEFWEKSCPLRDTRNMRQRRGGAIILVSLLLSTGMSSYIVVYLVFTLVIIDHQITGTKDSLVFCIVWYSSMV